MENIIAKLVHDFEQGKMTRRQLIQTLALTVTAASAADSSQKAPAPATGGSAFKALYFNHVSYQVADYAKTRDFYVDLFGMTVSDDNGKECRLTFGNNILIPRTRPSNTPRVDHISYTIAGWDENMKGVEAELKRRGLKPEPASHPPQGDSFFILDPDGFRVQLGGLRQ